MPTAGFQDIRLVDEWVAKFEYRPTACRRAYRMAVVRRNLSVSEPRQHRQFDDYRYFFDITNEPVTAEEFVFAANAAAIRRTCWRSSRRAGHCTRRWIT